jgi:hypothetical protein
LFKILHRFSNYKMTFLLGVICYSLMLIFAWLFYKERTVMCDAAFQLFSILHEDGFAIQINRFGAAFTQVFPLLASKMNFSLDMVARVYSLSFIIYYFIVFLIILLGFKNEKMALVVLLFNTLMVRHSFYWVQCEFVQGAVFTLLYLTVIEHVLKQEKVPRWFYILTPFFLVTIIYFYPLLLFIMFFGMAFFILNYPAKWRFLVGILAVYALMFVVKLKYLNNFYDSKSMEGIGNIFSKFPHYFDLPSFHQFYRYVINDYYFMVLFWVLTLAYLLYKKYYLHALLMSISLWGVCFIIHINFANGVEQFYIESQYLLFMVFVGMPFAYFLMQSVKLKPFMIGLLCFSLSISMLRMVVTQHGYAKRVEYIRSIVAESPTKRIMPITSLNQSLLKFTWGLPFEVWLLSTIEHHQTRSVAYEEKEHQYDDLLSNSQKMISLMGIYDYHALNTRYFMMDSTSFYTHY